MADAIRKNLALLTLLAVLLGGTGIDSVSMAPEPLGEIGDCGGSAERNRDGQQHACDRRIGRH